ncbi:MAG TPA: VWA domain-containing protein, partial [Dehalococcoidia bacterium]|nr:VWA domain-containing protein [Dehalococcoidia bacterium]
MSRRLIAIAILLAVLGGLAPGASARAQQTGPAVAVTGVDESAYPLVRAFVSVTDADGAPVAGLERDAFSVMVDATELKPDVAPASESPLALVLVVEASDSMRGGRLELVTQAASGLIRALGPDDRIALLAFGSETNVVVPLTADRARVVNGLTALQAGGGSALHEAVQAAVYVAVSSGAPRSAIVLLADGPGDPSPGVSAEAATSVAAGSGIPVYAIGLGDDAAPYLALLATATAGQFRPANAGNIGLAFEETAAAVQGQYALDFEVDAPADG